MRAVVAYDVSDDKQRKKVADILEMVMVRVQYSVFEGELPEEVLQANVKRAAGHLDPETDSLRVYRLCGACTRKITVYGQKVYVETERLRIL